MPREPSPAILAPSFIRTLRLKVKSEAFPWLNAAAIEVNQIWNFANETSARAACPFKGASKWLSAYDLDKLTAGATDYFEHVGSDTIQRVNAEFARRRKQFNKTKLRWRVSRGARRSLGWIPFKAVQLKRQGKSLRFSGKLIRVFERGLQQVSGPYRSDRSGHARCKNMGMWRVRWHA
jgi:putative transposase